MTEHFIRKYSERNNKNIKGITAEARDLLMRYTYPGNVRELENIIERAVVLARTEIVTTADIPLHLKAVESEEKICVAKRDGLLNETLETLERGIILDAMKKAGGVQTKAAEKLGISERVLRYKLKKYKIKEL